MTDTTLVFWAALAIGFAIGVVVTGFATAYMLRKGDRDVPGKRYVPVVVAALAAVAVFAGNVGSTLAQEEPTINIPTDVIFSSTNSWIVTFAPIAAIGIGITIALAVLGYLGKMIASAFKG